MSEFWKGVVSGVVLMFAVFSISFLVVVLSTVKLPPSIIERGGKMFVVRSRHQDGKFSRLNMTKI